MAKNKTLELSIRIAGRVDKSLTTAINQSNTLLGSLTTTMSKIGTAGLVAMSTLATATVVELTKCTKAAAALETDMSSVVRYAEGLTDASGKLNVENYKAMRAYIQDLSTDIPRTTQQITQMSAALGQSGISAQEQMKSGILRDTAIAATSMDLDDQTAGDYMAKWEEAFKFNHKQVMELMDQINYLGANNATTAAEIAQSVNQAASMGQIAGLDPKTTAAIATAMQATGVSTDRVGTTITRIYTNISKGANATKAQAAMWKELGFTAEGIAKSMQSDGVGTLLSVFEAVNNLPDERKVAALNTLFGQWAIEGGAKVTQNLELLQKTLREVNDASLYTGSMNKEFMIEASTPEAVDTMMSNAKTALMQDIGEAFLPAKKQFSETMIDFYNKARKNMPELTKLAQSLGELASKGVEKLGGALDDALPKIQNGIDYLLNNGDQVVSTIKKVAGALLVMKFAPGIKTLLGGIGNLLLGTKSASGSGIGSLLRKGGLFGVGGIIDAARAGAAMANSSITRIDAETFTDFGEQSFGQKLYNSIIGGITGIFNRKKLFATGITNKEGWANLVGTASNVANAKAFLPGIAKALGSNATTLLGAGAVGAGSILGGIGGAAGIGSGIYDIIKGTQSTGKDAKDKYFSGGSKIGMVGAGAAAGAGIGALFGGVGAVPGALIGAGVGGIGALFKGSAIGKALSDATDEGGWLYNTGHAISAFFTETLPEKWDVFWTGVGSFFTQSIPTWWSGVTEKVSTFFTKTIPEKWTRFWTGVGNFLTTTVPYAIGYAAGKVQIFFTQTIPEKWNAMWDAIGNFFTATLPTWASNVWNNNIVPFFTQTIPEKWDAMWAAIGNFFTTTVPTWASNTWNNNIIPFFTQTVPEKWDAMWTAIDSFFTTTIPTWASNTWNNNIVPFFTERIPQFFSDLWDSVAGFFSETLPSLASSIWGSIKGFFTQTIPGLLGNVWSSISGSASAGYAAATGGAKPHAVGGIFSQPHLGLVAEAGPESIIPLSAGMRGRGLSLWMQTGRMLGVSAGQALSALDSNAAELKTVDSGSADGGGGSFTFAPKITIQGNADADVLNEALRRAREEFESWYEQMMRRKARVAY